MSKLNTKTLKNKVNITVNYLNDPNYYYTTEMVRLNLDETREEDIRNGIGFIITQTQKITKDIKNQDGIFSSRFGSNSMSDSDAFTDKYRCACGHLRGKINAGMECPNCKTIVRFLDDNISTVGFLVTKQNQWIINPALYAALASFIGSHKLDNIIKARVPVNEDGIEMPIAVDPNDPYAGIGMVEFHNRFEEVMEYYHAKNLNNPNKEMAYFDIIDAHSKGQVWCHTIPVYTSLLRPISLENGSLKYEECNDEFRILAELVKRIRKDNLGINRKTKELTSLLYDIQVNYNKLYEKLLNILARKKGDYRSAIGGRYCYSARSVIIQDTKLRCDEIILPFAMLLELLQQVIINILVRSYHCSYAVAYSKWHMAQITSHDKIIYNIINGLIKDRERGLPVLINRNPSIQKGSLLFTYAVGISDDYTMSLNTQILPHLGADFDGDTLNSLYLYNESFINVAKTVLSPRYMYISNNDGLCNKDSFPARDIIINANAMKSIHRRYSAEQLERIRQCQKMV